MKRQATSMRVSDAPVSQSVSGPCETDIRAQLHRISTSHDFKVPDRVRRFLSYVVEQTLAGRADRIKAYSVAVEVFGRDTSIDTLNDPVVRIEAGRLRRALELYYFLEGKTDLVLIEIPKGSYVPCFSWRLDHQTLAEPLPPPTPRPSPQSRPGFVDWLTRPWLVTSIAAVVIGILAMFIGIPDRSRFALSSTSRAGFSLLVKPFVTASRTPEADVFAAGLSDEMLSQLATFRDLTIIRSEAFDALVPRASAAQTRRHFEGRQILEGMIRVGDGKLRITSRLIEGETASVIWSGLFEADLNGGNIIDLQNGVATKIATAVAQAIRRPQSASSTVR